MAENAALLHRLFVSIFTGWGLRGIAVAVNIVQIHLLFRYLQAQLLGVWFLMIGAQSFVGLFDFGYGQTIQRRLAYAKAKCGSDPSVSLDDAARQEVLDVLAVGRRVFGALSAIVFVVLFVGGGLYFETIGTDLPRATVFSAWLVMSLGFSLNVWASYVDGAVCGMGDMAWSNIANAVVLVAGLAGTWFVLASGHGLIGLAMVWVGKGAGLRAAAYYVLRRRYNWMYNTNRRASWKDARDLLTPSVQWWLIVIGWTLSTSVARYLIGLILGEQNVPDFAATYTALNTIQVTLVSTVSIGNPLFAQSLKAGAVEDVRDTIIPLMGAALTGLTVVYAQVAVTGRGLFELWLGHGHFVGQWVLLVMILTMLLEAHQGMLQSACIAAEKFSYYKYSLLSGFLSVMLGLLLTARVGILGAALSTLLAQAITVNWAVPRLGLRILKSRFSDDINRVLLPSVFFGGGSYGLGWLAKNWGPKWLSIGVAFAVTAAALLGALAKVRKLRRR